MQVKYPHWCDGCLHLHACSCWAMECNYEPQTNPWCNAVAVILL